MGKKAKTVFVCQSCGYESMSWQGRCICGEWNTMVEEKIVASPSISRGVSGDTRQSSSKPKALSGVSGPRVSDRIDTGIGELNRVLGGGVIRGSLTLISGEPGIGKSTIIMQTANNVSKKVGRVLYITGEESEDQIKIRADRICENIDDGLMVYAEIAMEKIVDVVEDLEPKFLIIDSIQTMYMSQLDSAPGSVSQVRACTNELMRIGKTKDIPVFIVAHVTKSGELAGPKVMEHLVDCLLHFSGERSGELRILRSLKNRFGNTSEIGAFEMGEDGLVEIQDLSRRFLADIEEGVEGAVVTAVHEGSRPLLLEVQALVASSNMNYPRRSTIGVDTSRVSMILAVLEKRAGVKLSDRDVYVNIVGGMKPEGTYMDLAIAIAIDSTIRGRCCQAGTMAVGEIGLTGDLRPVRYIEKIVVEAERMGFKRLILQKNQSEKLQKMNLGLKNLKLVGVRTLKEALEIYS